MTEEKHYEMMRYVNERYYKQLREMMLDIASRYVWDGSLCIHFIVGSLEIKINGPLVLDENAGEPLGSPAQNLFFPRAEDSAQDKGMNFYNQIKMTDYNLICTTIDQSKRLVEYGLDPKSADCYYSIRRSVKKDDAWVPELYDLYVGTPSGENTCPAWSFGMLLVISTPIRTQFDIAITGMKPSDDIQFLVDLIVGNMNLVSPLYRGRPLIVPLDQVPPEYLAFDNEAWLEMRDGQRLIIKQDEKD